MQRLIEQSADEGDVVEREVHLGRVHYHLAVYQHFSDQEGEPVPANVEVEGHVTALDGQSVAELHRTKAELTLQLADGRLLDFVITNENGAIRSTGRGLFKPQPQPGVRRERKDRPQT